MRSKLKKQVSCIVLCAAVISGSFTAGSGIFCGHAQQLAAEAGVIKNGWSKDKKYYYDENGEKAAGIIVLDGKFYCFTAKGKYNQKKTKKIQRAAVYEGSFPPLKKLIGKPKKTKYYASCYGKGKDGILTYDKFTVYTFLPDQGSEIFMGAE